MFDVSNPEMRGNVVAEGKRDFVLNRVRVCGECRCPRIPFHLFSDQPDFRAIEKIRNTMTVG